MNKNAAYPKGADGKPSALEARTATNDGRRFSPSIGRNRDVVRDVFLSEIGPSGRVLEIASGTGEHGAHITASAPDIEWTYSDYQGANAQSQTAWAAHEGHGRLHGPFAVDASASDWGEAEAAGPYKAIVCINMIHISPFTAAQGLIAGASRLLKSDGKLFLYGPYARKGEIAPSNERFDTDLKRRDPAWGVRDLDEDIMPLADAAGLSVAKIFEMPANNLSVIFQRD